VFDEELDAEEDDEEKPGLGQWIAVPVSAADLCASSNICWKFCIPELLELEEEDELDEEEAADEEDAALALALAEAAAAAVEGASGALGGLLFGTTGFAKALVQRTNTKLIIFTFLFIRVLRVLRVLGGSFKLN